MPVLAASTIIKKIEWFYIKIYVAYNFFLVNNFKSKIIIKAHNIKT